jgi:hypothetical protein
MKHIDLDNLFIKLHRGRTRTLFFQFGKYMEQEFLVMMPNPYIGYPLTPIFPRVDHVPATWVPLDITAYRFSFSIEKNWGPGFPPTITPIIYDPVINLANPTTGVLAWNVYATDLDQLQPANYYFSMSVISDGFTIKHLCGGVIALLDSAYLDVKLPTYARFPLNISSTSDVAFNVEEH